MRLAVPWRAFSPRPRRRGARRSALAFAPFQCRGVSATACRGKREARARCSGRGSGRAARAPFVSPGPVGPGGDPFEDLGVAPPAVRAGAVGGPAERGDGRSAGLGQPVGGGPAHDGVRMFQQTGDRRHGRAPTAAQRADGHPHHVGLRILQQGRGVPEVGGPVEHGA